MSILKSNVTWIYLTSYIFVVVMFSIVIDIFLWKFKKKTYQWIKKYYNIQNVNRDSFEAIKPNISALFQISKKQNTLISTIMASIANVLIANTFENFQNHIIYEWCIYLILIIIYGIIFLIFLIFMRRHS